MEEKLLTVHELAEHLSLPPSWIYHRTRTGKIPTIRAGKYCRFLLSQVMEWLKSQQQGGRVGTIKQGKERFGK